MSINVILINVPFLSFVSFCGTRCVIDSICCECAQIYIEYKIFLVSSENDVSSRYADAASQRDYRRATAHSESRVSQSRQHTEYILAQGMRKGNTSNCSLLFTHVTFSFSRSLKNMSISREVITRFDAMRFMYLIGVRANACDELKDLQVCLRRTTVTRNPVVIGFS